ncbi:hypothetical protein COCMIDRAFT_39642 [Bipolaris oryzae ATCC 44560]|uniref:Cytochrome P450 n=1 Tax=Bipolaris oryzae ATCC 44560 TaxID=930090 RepID=W6YS36_COCMI|nr:uncharacterized protein COCMIDRAFT_39642 [Bipolaris oryzae ATCC 44560]EUC42257.1 hypothetical protein COCMIDRAFT_39642 [Bipolaris oryzae ATCC 44560]
MNILTLVFVTDYFKCAFRALYRVVFNVFLHPLSIFPGPKHLAACGFFHSYNNQLKVEWYKYMLKVHDKYGPIVRVGPDHLAVDGSIGWSEVFGHKRADRQEFGRYPGFYSPGKDDPIYLFSADRTGHRRQRRLLSHAFSDASMYEQEALITTHINLLIFRLHTFAERNEPLDAVQWYSFATFDIIGDLAFGESFGCLENNDLHPWVANMFNTVKAALMIQFLNQYPLLRPFGRVLGKKLLAQRKEHSEFAAGRAKQRLSLDPATNSRKDFVTYILRHNDEKGMSEGEIMGNLNKIIVAGSETTATTLSALTLTEEIRQTFSSEDQITMSSTAPLSYLHACLQEGLRIYPPTAETPPRVSPGDFIAGKYVPQGTRISIYQWASYHSARNFVKPSEFKPERWLPPTHPYHDPVFNHDNKDAFNAFSYGPRNCIGKNLAYAELRLIMTRVLWNFDISLVDGYESWTEHHKVFSIWQKTPLMVRLSRVARSEST